MQILDRVRVEHYFGVQGCVTLRVDGRFCSPVVSSHFVILEVSMAWFVQRKNGATVPAVSLD